VAAAAYIITAVSYDRKIITTLATDICKKKMILPDFHKQISILLSGGYYNGRTSMSFPLTEYLTKRGDGLIGLSDRSRTSGLTDRWEYVGSLSEERQWGPGANVIKLFCP
jgi:hypothetical protein